MSRGARAHRIGRVREQRLSEARWVSWLQGVEGSHLRERHAREGDGVLRGGGAVLCRDDEGQRRHRSREGGGELERRRLARAVNPAGPHHHRRPGVRGKVHLHEGDVRGQQDRVGEHALRELHRADASRGLDAEGGEHGQGGHGRAAPQRVNGVVGRHARGGVAHRHLEGVQPHHQREHLRHAVGHRHGAERGGHCAQGEPGARRHRRRDGDGGGVVGHFEGVCERVGGEVGEVRRRRVCDVGDGEPAEQRALRSVHLEGVHLAGVADDDHHLGAGPPHRHGAAEGRGVGHEPAGAAGEGVGLKRRQRGRAREGHAHAVAVYGDLHRVGERRAGERGRD
eukprot:6890165-Pyramimonas_sp.AAC.3